MTIDHLREKFDRHGEIKTFFSLIDTRGMLFVTYVSEKKNWSTKVSCMEARADGLENSLILEPLRKPSWLCRTLNSMVVKLMFIILYPKRRSAKQNVIRIKIRCVALKISITISKTMSNKYVREKGTLLFTLVGTNHNVDNNELTNFLSRYGDVKSVRPSPLHGRYNGGTVDAVKR